jgi:hypothetical protein
MNNRSTKYWVGFYVLLMLGLVATLVFNDIDYQNKLLDKDASIQALQEKLDKNVVYNAEYYADRISSLIKQNKELQTAYLEVFDIAKDANERNIIMLQEKISGLKNKPWHSLVLPYDGGMNSDIVNVRIIKNPNTGEIFLHSKDVEKMFQVLLRSELTEIKERIEKAIQQLQEPWQENF